MKEEELIESSKPKKNKVTTIFSNVLFTIVMVILVVFLGYSIGSVSQNKVPSFFGKSYVRILTGSMRDSGFYETDVVMIKKVKLSEIKVGDIVAFYWAPVHSAPTFATNPALNDMETGSSSFDVAIVFHKVAEVRVDTRGNLWVKTYGTSNFLFSTSVDKNGDGVIDEDVDRSTVEYSYDGWTKGDHIVGVYEENIFSGIIQFISSTTGIIAIVIIPSCIVLFILLMRIIDILDKIAQEKKKNQQENMDKINEIKGLEGDSSAEEEQQEQTLESESENTEVEGQEEQLEQQLESEDNEVEAQSQEQTEQATEPQSEEQQDVSVGENQEQPVAQEEQTEQPVKKPRKSKKSTSNKRVVDKQQDIAEAVSDVEQVEDLEVVAEQPKTKKPRKKLEKEEREQIRKQVDELVEKSKTRKKKTEENQDV